MIKEESNKPENLEEAIEKIQCLEIEIYNNRTQLVILSDIIDKLLSKLNVADKPSILMP